MRQQIIRIWEVCLRLMVVDRFTGRWKLGSGGEGSDFSIGRMEGVVEFVVEWLIVSRDIIVETREKFQMCG